MPMTLEEKLKAYDGIRNILERALHHKVECLLDGVKELQGEIEKTRQKNDELRKLRYAVL